MDVLSPGAASRLAGRLLFCVAELVSTERLAVHGRGACLPGAPKMGDTIANEGHREEQPAKVLGASGVCRRKGAAAQLVRRGGQGDLADATEHQGPVRQPSICGNNRVVFNVGGNKYRLVVEIQYQAGMVWVKFVGTHAQYDRIDVETVNDY
jgi:hypothetical protein